MRRISPRVITGALATLLLLALSPVALADTFTTNCFVDLDGDGLDDNLIDFKDGFFLDEDADNSVLGGEVIDYFSTLDETPVDLPQTNKESFTSRRFNARAICNCRRDFDGDFDSGSGSGGSSSGKTCVGGVCF